VSKSHPRVSIGVPVFNGERFLAETLDSLLSQTFSDFEIVISDNASTDRTQDICRAYAARDPRVRYYRSDTNRGAAWNHNRVFDLARGEYFKWNSADDLCAPEFLVRCVAALDQDPAAVMAISEALDIDQCGERLPSVRIPGLTLLPVVPLGAPAHVRLRQNLRMDHLCMTIYSLIRSDILRQTDLIGGYPDSDRTLLAHLALLGHCAVIPEVLLFNRDHTGRFSRVHEEDYHDGWRKQVGWFNPSSAGRKNYPFWRKSFELWRVLSRNPLKRQERLRCYWVMSQWLLRSDTINSLFRDATFYPRKYIIRRFPRAKLAWNWLWGNRNVVDQIRGTQAARNVTSSGASGSKR
jgi:glycosyltransferase involved in cell wall biosynthesis